MSQLPSLSCFAPLQGGVRMCCPTRCLSLRSCAGDEEMALQLGIGAVVLGGVWRPGLPPPRLCFGTVSPFRM